MIAWPIETSSRYGRWRKSGQVGEVEIVAGVDAEAESVRERGGLGIRGERCAAGLVAPLERPRERLGVQLDAIGAGRGCPADGVGGRVDKQAHAYASGVQARDCLGQPLASGPGRQPAWLVTSPGTTGTSVH